MAEGTYEYECARAELLGIAPPDRESFEAAAVERHQLEEREELDERLEVEVQDEQLKGTSGKLDELNSILSVTQQRLTKFKSACGSLTHLLKLRPADHKDDGATSTSSVAATEKSEGGGSGDVGEALDEMKVEKTLPAMRSSAMDMQQKMTCQFDALDSMLAKAETAELAMDQQTRQMKRMMK